MQLGDGSELKKKVAHEIETSLLYVIIYCIIASVNWSMSRVWFSRHPHPQVSWGSLVIIWEMPYNVTYSSAGLNDFPNRRDVVAWWCHQLDCPVLVLLPSLDSRSRSLMCHMIPSKNSTHLHTARFLTPIYLQFKSCVLTCTLKCWHCEMHWGGGSSNCFSQDMSCCCSIRL